MSAQLIPFEARRRYQCFKPEFIVATLDLACAYRNTPAFDASDHPKDWIEQPQTPRARFNHPLSDKDYGLLALSLTVKEMLNILDEAGLYGKSADDLIRRFGGLKKLWDAADTQMWSKLKKYNRAKRRRSPRTA